MVADYQFRLDLNQPDPKKKNPEWASRLITEFRKWMSPMVDPKKAAINRSYLYGQQDVEKYKEKFKVKEDKDNKYPFDFEPLGIFEKYRNILTAEREKAGIDIQLTSNDPTALEKKEFDKQLVVNGPFIENLISANQLAMGFPPYKISEDTSEEGEKVANGNIDSFQELGLNPNSAEDIAYWFKTHYRLDVEIAAETVVNHFTQVNEMEEYLKYWCDDMLAVKCIAGRVYADETTYLPKFQYIRPEDVRWIKGQRRDGKDAQAIMMTKDFTIIELISFMGSEFKTEYIEYFLNALNFQNHTHYDGFSKGGDVIANCSHPIDYDTFLGTKIGVGYIEWKSVDAKAERMTVTPDGKLIGLKQSLDWTPEPGSGLRKEVTSNIKTKKAYFIMKNNAEQIVFKFGDLFDMQTYGPEDEYSNFSFCLYRELGKSAVEIAIPFIDTMHDAFFRALWLLNKTKPRGYRYDYAVLSAVAKLMYRDMDTGKAIQKIIENTEAGVNDFYVSLSKNPDVNRVDPHFEKKNGVDPAMQELWNFFLAQETQISDKLGINAIREGYSPAPNDGYKLQMETLQQSRNATQYIESAIMHTIKHAAVITTGITQDMLEDESSHSYKAIEKAVGYKNVKSLRDLKRVPLHKFGIFVESMNVDMDRRQIQQEAQLAWQAKEIQYHVYVLVKQIKSPKRAAQILIYEKNKEVRIRQQEAKTAFDNEMAKEQQTHKNNMELETLKGENSARDGQIRNQGMVDVANIQQGAHIEAKKIMQQGEKNKADVRADAKIREEEAKANIAKGDPSYSLNDL